MKKALAFIFALLLVSTLASAYVIRDVAKERQAELDRYNQYKTDYMNLNNLKGYEDYVYEPNLVRNFGFKPASYYYVPQRVLNEKYNPSLQGEFYSTSNRRYTNSLNQPSAVKYYGEVVNGRYTGYIQPDLNGVYFDHPSARETYGYTTNSYNGYYGGSGCNSGYNGCTESVNARFYARVADQVTDDYYVVGYY